jgi:K(+)-stimulated pyrophosphate-energized sodium pump
LVASNWFYIAPIGGVAAVIFAFYLAWDINKYEMGTPTMRGIADSIREGSKAYLKRQYTTITIISVILTVILYIAFDWGDRPYTSFAFILGAGCSLLAGYVGMDVATRANVRTANATKTGLNPAIQVAFRGGMVMGLLVVGLSLLGVTVLFVAYGEDPELIVGYAFGASLAALFAQLGGGIFTKAADIGADLVGKIEVGIPEDDPRNPAVIADNVGDNVGDVAGRGADLFESTAGENIGAMILGVAIFVKTGDINWVYFPLVARGGGIFATILATYFVTAKEGENPMAPLRRGLYATTIMCVVIFYILCEYMLENINMFYAALAGLAAALVIAWITEYYTSKSFRPVKEIARSSETGPATNIMTGFSVGLESTALPAIVLSVAILVSFVAGNGWKVSPVTDEGVYGTAVATMAMLSTAGIILAMDGFGPIADNAGGIAEMSDLEPEYRQITDELDAVGNTTKAITKGYAMGSAALAALLLFEAYLETADIDVVDLSSPEIVVGLLIGAMLPFIFSSLAIRAVGNASYDMINEVRRQFKEIPGIMEGTTKPDYAKCVDISTRSAQKNMVFPGMICVIGPISVGFLLGAEAVGALLMGGTVTGIMLALSLNNSGASWDNAKKLIEDGAYGGKGTPAHAAGVVGDTVGDPFKDTAGPSLHVLVKLLSTLSLTFATLFVEYSLFF